MKKFFVAAIVALMAVCVNAQNIYVGGSIGAWRDGAEKQTNINILPEIGYNVDETISVGTTIGWDWTHQKGYDLNLFKLAPYLRYNVVKAGKVNLFVDGGVDLGFGSAKEDGESSSTAVTYGIGFKPGVSYALSDHCSLVAHFGFLGYMDGNNAAKDAASVVGYKYGWGFDFSNSLSFGFYYTF